MNTLYYGDNLAVMREYIEDGSIDLIYLDPPFKSNRNYNILYKTMTGKDVPEQVEAFCDTWKLDSEKEDLVKKIPSILVQGGYDDDFIKFWKNLIEALRNLDVKLFAYLVYMTVRLIEMKRVLKRTGSIYLHCDPAASHYIKITMDGIFGHKNFRNEIVWSYSTGGISRRTYAKKHDIILWYTCGPEYFFNLPRVKSRDEKRFNQRDEGGRKYYEKAGNRYYLEKGVALRDVWDDIYPVRNVSKERLGYPTQKPMELLKRIIGASCPEGGRILDPFCGCGTTIATAHIENRNWIGIDITILSINLIKTRVLEDRYGLKEGESYRIKGIPITKEGAEKLFQSNVYQFQNWCIETAGGFCNSRSRKDAGIDGLIYYEDEEEGSFNSLKRMILSVKGGKNLKPGDVRDLAGTMKREDADLGGLICLHDPTQGMEEEARNQGRVELFERNFPRIQILTVEEMLRMRKEGRDIFWIPNKLDNQNRSDQFQLRMRD